MIVQARCVHHAALDHLGEQLLDGLDGEACAIARALWEELDRVGKARALARLVAKLGPLRDEHPELMAPPTSAPSEDRALQLAIARLELRLGPPLDGVGSTHLLSTLHHVLESQRGDARAEPSASLEGEIAESLATLVAFEVRRAGPLAGARAAMELAELGALDAAASALRGQPEIIVALEADANRADLEDHERDFALALADELARVGDAAEYTAFLTRNLDRHPRLLDRVVERALEAEDWERVLELARRGLALREDRARYNALAAQALDRLGRALP